MTHFINTFMEMVFKNRMTFYLSSFIFTLILFVCGQWLIGVDQHNWLYNAIGMLIADLILIWYFGGYRGIKARMELYMSKKG